MNKSSRAENVVKNAAVSLICQVITVVLQFIGRTFFIKLLGKDYLGVSSLFANILTILSFAELGIGNGMIFSMYKPLASNDKEKLKSLMSLYKRAYTNIGVIVTIA